MALIIDPINHTYCFEDVSDIIYKSTVYILTDPFEIELWIENYSGYYHLKK